LFQENQIRPSEQRISPVLLIQSGHEKFALHLDEIAGTTETIVKPMPPMFSKATAYLGVTALNNGDLALLINPLSLLQLHGDSNKTNHLSSLVTQTTQPVASILGASSQQHTILVVDDSLTIRKVSEKLLRKEGYQVLLAKDGVEALQIMQTTTPDCMLVDIEMPRMDGFDLTRNVRYSDTLKNIPIIMISSRSAEKHQEQAKKLGVNLYLSKPFQEKQLLASIESLIAEKQ
jgi:chemosensory pili system protein ChpA (sensor histidine kinase/response regulator)